MLYQIYETQRALMEPFAEFAQASAKLYSHPLSPFGQTPLAQRVSASFDLMHRLWKDYEKPEFGIRTVQVGERRRGRCRSRWRSTKPFCELRRFKRFSDDPATLAKMKAQPTVLVVAPLSGHHATLLRDTVHSLLPDHKVYITDWTERAHGPARRRACSTSTTTSPTCRSSSATCGHLRQLPRHLRLPADRAGAGRGVADGHARRSDAADHDDDGRPDRRPQVARRR